MTEHCVKVNPATPWQPWLQRGIVVAVASFAFMIAPTIIDGVVDVFVPSYLRDNTTVALTFFVGAYIMMWTRRHWPPAHWCFTIDDRTDDVMAYDQHHYGLVGHGATIEAACRDAVRQYFWHRFL